MKLFLAVLAILLATVIADAKDLRPLIKSAAKRYNLDEQLLTAILTHESRLMVSKIGKNKDGTKDYGIGQINERTIAAYGMDKHRLLTDEAYSIEQSAKVLAWFQKSFKDAQWFCRYNVGTGKMTKKRQRMCIAYSHKVFIYIADDSSLLKEL